MGHGGVKRRRVTVTAATMHAVLIVFAFVAGVGLLMLTLRSVEPSEMKFNIRLRAGEETEADRGADLVSGSGFVNKSSGNGSCATVDEMGKAFENGDVAVESLRVRKLIRNHFDIYGASRVRKLPPDQFCKHGFVIGKAYQAGFGNEMYKLLTAAALSIMLNRSLIIGQTRGRYPFGDYISYSNETFTLREIKRLWNQNDCVQKYGRHLIVRFDDFQKPSKTGVLCSNWLEWEEPIIWFDSTTDAVAAQFFLKNVHLEMRNVAMNLFGDPGRNLESRPNVFGELMRVLISPSKDVQEALRWVLKGGLVPDVTLHMRMLMNSSVRAVQAAMDCIRQALRNLPVPLISMPRVVLVSDTPKFIEEVTPLVNEFAEVLHFNYEAYGGNLSGEVNRSQNLDFRAKDWGPAPRWVAFVDFFLASLAKHAVVSGAHRRVGTTYAQLIAALAAANKLDESDPSSSSLVFLSSFQHSLLSEGLGSQIGWGHVWNRFSGPLSCHNQSNQCAHTPLLPPAWWDGIWQSPTQRDVHRLQGYGVQLSGLGTFDQQQLQSYCNSRKYKVTTLPVSQI